MKRPPYSVLVVFQTNEKKPVRASEFHSPETFKDKENFEESRGCTVLFVFKINKSLAAGLQTMAAYDKKTSDDSIFQLNNLIDSITSAVQGKLATEMVFASDKLEAQGVIKG